MAADQLVIERLLLDHGLLPLCAECEVTPLETSWIEDFLALVDCANFCRAAARRNVTQPALSRRIRLLEQWVGAPLFDRSTHQIGLTAAGQHFLPVANEVMRRLHLGREAAREAAACSASSLRFLATHALALTFFPAWLRSLEAVTSLGGVTLVADNMQACEEMMLAGQAQFLLCHHHPAAATRLDSRDFRPLPIGRDVLLPVSAPDEAGRPIHPLPGQESCPASFLAFSSQSGMGRILAAARSQSGPPAFLETVFSSHVATLLKTMAAGGRGLAWSALSLVRDDLARGTLVRAGDESWDVPMEIRVFRPRFRQSAAAEAFWAQATQAAAEQPSL